MANGLAWKRWTEEGRIQPAEESTDDEATTGQQGVSGGGRPQIPPLRGRDRVGEKGLYTSDTLLLRFPLKPRLEDWGDANMAALELQGMLTEALGSSPSYSFYDGLMELWNSAGRQPH